MVRTSLSAYAASALLLLPAVAQALGPHGAPAHRRHHHAAEHARSLKGSSGKSFKYTPAKRDTPLPKVAGTWFAGWHGGDGDFPPEDLSWEKYTVVTYAFAETQPDPANLTVSAADDPILKRVVQLGHEVGTSITISIGGWTGSRYFSTAVGSAANRTKFINAITDIVAKYNLDGVDFDWEYPNNQGIGCNLISPNDSANLLETFKELRASPKFGKDRILTAATGLLPFTGPDGTPMTDVSEFAQFLDYVEIMNYDIWGSWSPTAGPNAPLNDTCLTDAAQKVGSAVSAIETWTKAGFPADQLVLAVGSYGHSYSVSKDAALVGGVLGSLIGSFPAFDKTNQPVGDVWDAAPALDVCGVQEGQGGVFDFWGLITTGFLTENGTAAAGIEYLYDTCTHTPSIYNPDSGVWVSYDDARSFGAKGWFIHNAGLRGFSMWEAGSDFDDILLDAIRSGAWMPALANDCGGEPITTTRTFPTSTPVPTASKA